MIAAVLFRLLAGKINVSTPTIYYTCTFEDRGVRTSDHIASLGPLLEKN